MIDAKIYPAGTKIRYIGSAKVINSAKKDIGKCGVIVEHRNCNCPNNIDGKCPNIYLPESRYVSSLYSTPGKPVTWATGWDKIKILPQKNQQLLFDFAY